MEQNRDEVYIEVDIEGIVEKEWISKIGDTCKFVALDSETPYLQLGPYIFQGQYKDAIGTSVFFEEHKDLDGETSLKMKCHTFKKLEMKRCFLNQKQQDCELDGLTHESSATDETTAKGSSDSDNATVNEATHQQADETAHTQASLAVDRLQAMETESV